jgi:hypothetical protein
MEWTKARRLDVVLCCVALSLLMGVADAAPLTVQELLAEEDLALVNEWAEHDRREFAVPDDIPLDPPLREAAERMAQEHAARVRELLPVWIAQERAASGTENLRSAALSHLIFRRVLNEEAIWWVEGGGQANDDAWLKAALAPKACSQLPPTYFGRRMAMIQSAPLESRPALLAAEREMLLRWGTKRQSLPRRPEAAELDAAARAITLLRAGMPVTVEPMTPFLAWQLFMRNRKPGKPDRWEQCAQSQWWLASQLADGKADRTKALAVYRYSTMLDVGDFVPSSVMKGPAATRPEDGKQTYPPAARYFDAEGSTTVEVETDVNGKFVDARVVGREITVPGVRDNPPVAFEALFDAAALDYFAKRSYADGKAGRHEFKLVWRLK